MVHCRVHYLHDRVNLDEMMMSNMVWLYCMVVHGFLNLCEAVHHDLLMFLSDRLAHGSRNNPAKTIQS